MRSQTNPDHINQHASMVIQTIGTSLFLRAHFFVPCVVLNENITSTQHIMMKQRLSEYGTAQVFAESVQTRQQKPLDRDLRCVRKFGGVLASIIFSARLNNGNWGLFGKDGNRFATFRCLHVNRACVVEITMAIPPISPSSHPAQ